MKKIQEPSGNPYKVLPTHAFWRQSVAETEQAMVAPALASAFHLTSDDRIATAGSCFAQHIARYLRKSGCNYFVAENAHPLIDPEVAKELQYGLFSARFGNIYTTRQLLQLFQRAYGQVVPKDDHWVHGSRYVDPYRPSIQPDGFISVEELHADRAQHLDYVRRMFEELDCFVFTLGLTEAWINAEDGFVYPVCPGTAYGVHSPAQHRYVNFGVSDTIADLTAFIALLRDVNKDARIILTVSPVPLIATMSGTHVLAATTYSKSVLRVAAEEIARSERDVAYFPSYEIITGAHARGQYFDEDLRSVREEGVAHVMRCFFQTFLPSVTLVGQREKLAAKDQISPRHDLPQQPSPESLSAAVADVLCDEESLVL